LRERLRVAAAKIFQHVGEPTSGAETDDRWWRQRYDGSTLDLAELGAEPLDNLWRPSEASLRSSKGLNDSTMNAAFDCE